MSDAERSKKKPARKKKFLAPTPQKKRDPAMPRAKRVPVVDAALHEAVSEAGIRYKARMAFVTDVNQGSLADLAAQPEYAHLTLDVLRRWAASEKWTQERAAFLTRMAQRIEDTIADQLTERRVSMLKKLETITDKAMEVFSPHDYNLGMPHAADDVEVCCVCGRPKPGHGNYFFGVSGDKVIMAVAKLYTLESDITDRLAQLVARKSTSPSGPKSLSSGAPDVLPPETKGTGLDAMAFEADLTPAEARAAAHAILRVRYKTDMKPRTGDDDDEGE